ncbi:hypothetical protein CMO86_04855 [Candidatus Woesearchaeota archaeon]|jgi:hypothetical protein|nr:hypothetical protein [Candidatus Woesearchaeota archaeon]|tara:strand:- start:710 stop:913 length:204 start_codon:yes stop_codon:yes gene_type:complete
MVKNYLILGYGILIAAILFNLVLSKLGLSSWYDLLLGNKDKYTSLVILFIIYPIILGYVAQKVMELI